MEIEITDLSSSSTSSIFLTGDTYFSSEFWDENPFSTELLKQIRSTEFSITNLEASMKPGDPLLKQGPNLSTTERTHRMLVDSGFDAVSLANNHIMDYGKPGLERTLNTCSSFGLDTVGAGMDALDAREPIRCEINDTSVGVFAVTEHEEMTATDTSPGTCWVRTPGISAAIQEESENFDVTILIAHGGVEYVPLPPRSWRRCLRGFAELDIDAVIAHHPHCPQAWEIHDGTPIFYSLGNFLMYRDIPATTRSYGVNIVADNGEISTAEVVPFSAQDGKVKELPKHRDSGYHQYLTETATQLQEQSNYHSYWQEIALRLFESDYKSRFSDYGRNSFTSLISHPIKEIDRLTRGCFGTCAIREKDIGLLDYLGNESHRDIVSTALDIRVGNKTDVRTDVAISKIDSWYPYYDGRPIRSWSEKQRSRLKTLIGRLA